MLYKLVVWYIVHAMRLLLAAIFDPIPKNHLFLRVGLNKVFGRKKEKGVEN
jgi:hypothetical protein